jgi:hypothetical protein
MQPLWDVRTFRATPCWKAESALKNWRHPVLLVPKLDHRKQDLMTVCVFGTTASFLPFFFRCRIGIGYGFFEGDVDPEIRMILEL